MSENKQKIIAFLITIAILVGIGFGVYYFIFGENGLINKITSVENEYEKTEVLEKLNDLLKEKYMAIYNESKSNPEIKLSESYNSDVAISYFFEKEILDYYYYSEYNEENNEYKYIANSDVNENTLKRNDLYYIKSKNIENVESFGNGEKYTSDLKVNKNDVFILEKKTENDISTYILKYYDKIGNEKEVGTIELANPLKK